MEELESQAEALSANVVPEVIDGEIAAAAEGDMLHVHHKVICGFAVTKRLTIMAHNTKVVACPSSPGPVASNPQLKAGALIDAAASGTSLEGFRFEGSGAAKAKVGALSFGVFSRGAENVIVMNNRFEGTVQAVTSVGGKGWVIKDNRMLELEVFPCPGACGGGIGIVLAHSPSTTASSDNAVVWRNRISSRKPPAGLPFAVTGILVWAVESANLLRNRIDMAGSPTTGIDVTRSAQGGVVLSGSCNDARILENRVRADDPISVKSDCLGSIELENRETASGGIDLITVSSLRQAAAQSTTLAARPLGID